MSWVKAVHTGSKANKKLHILSDLANSRAAYTVNS